MKLLSKNYTNGLMDGILTYKFLIGADNLSVSDNVNIQQVNYRTKNYDNRRCKNDNTWR